MQITSQQPINFTSSMASKKVDYSRVSERHKDVHIRLEQWGRWNTDRGAPAIHPMFRMYQSKARQWEMPEIRVIGSPTQNLEIERIVRDMPEKHREAIRWAYVWPYINEHKILRMLAVTRERLAELIEQGRDIVNNRIRVCP